MECALASAGLCSRAKSQRVDAVGACVFLVWRYVCLVLLPFFQLGCLGFLLLSCMSCLCVLEIKSLLVTLFGNILSHSVGCLFHLIYGFLCCAKACKFD